MIELVSEGMIPNTHNKRYLIDSANELGQLEAGFGNEAYCVANRTTYICNSSGEWLVKTEGDSGMCAQHSIYGTLYEPIPSTWLETQGGSLHKLIYNPSYLHFAIPYDNVGRSVSAFGRILETFNHRCTIGFVSTHRNNVDNAPYACGNLVYLYDSNTFRLESYEAFWVIQGGTQSITLDANAINAFFLYSPKAQLDPLLAEENGVYDAPERGCDGFQYVTVSVPTSSATLGPKSITENGTYEAQLDGLDGFDVVDVNVESPIITSGPLGAYENGLYSPGSYGFDYFSDVDVQVTPNVGSLNVLANGSYNATDEGLEGFSSVEVAVPQEQPNLGTRSISSNGTYDASSDGYDGYSSVTVSVSSSGSPKQLAAEGTIANPDDTVTAGSMLAMAFANNKCCDLSYEFGGSTYVFPLQIRSNGHITASLNDISNGVVTIGFIDYTFTNLRLSLNTLFLAQVNTDGTGFVDLSSMLPTSTAATLTGYYWD